MALVDRNIKTVTTTGPTKLFGLNGDDRAAFKEVDDFATAAQGALADSAVQPGDLDSAAYEPVSAFATSAQGSKADSAVQPGDLDGDKGDITVSSDGAVYELNAGIVDDANIASGTALANRLTHTVSVTDPQFGASLSGGQSASTRRAAMQAAIDWGAANGAKVFIPAGTWIISDYLEVHSGSVIEGFAIDVTTIQASTTFPEDSNMLQPSAFDMSVGNVRISDLTLDGNRAARVAAGTVVLPPGGLPGTQRPGASGWASMSAHSCVIERVKSKGMALHAFDDCAGGDITPGGARSYCYPEGPTTYSTTPSRHNTYIDCVAEDWYDDGFTTHFNEYATFVRCRAIDSGSTSSSSCGFELDDGSLYVTVRDCYVKGVARGIIAKNHADVPCASYVSIIGCEIVGCNHGITAAGDTVSGPVGKVYRIIGNTVRDPQVIASGFDLLGIRIANVVGVVCTGNHILAEPGRTGLNSAYYVNQACADVLISDFLVENWPGDLNTDTDIAAVRISLSADVVLGTGRIVNPGIRGVYWSGTVVGARNVGPLHITGTGVANAVAFHTTANMAAGNIFMTTSGFAVAFKDSVGDQIYDMNHMGAGLRLEGMLNFGNQTSYTIASGSITIGQASFIAVDTEAASATDDLDNIVGGRAGDLIIVKSATSVRDVTLKDMTGSGSSALQLAGDFTLASSSDMIALMHNGSNWVELFRKTNI